MNIAAMPNLNWMLKKQDEIKALTEITNRNSNYICKVESFKK